MVRLRFIAQPVDRHRGFYVKMVVILCFGGLIFLLSVSFISGSHEKNNTLDVGHLSPLLDRHTQLPPPLLWDWRNDTSFRYPAADLISLLPEACHGYAFSNGVLLIVLAILNLTVISGGVLMYSFRSDCKFRFSNGGFVWVSCGTDINLDSKFQTRLFLAVACRWSNEAASVDHQTPNVRRRTVTQQPLCHLPLRYRRSNLFVRDFLYLQHSCVVPVEVRSIAEGIQHPDFVDLRLSLGFFFFGGPP